jgi:hypothetical protein
VRSTKHTASNCADENIYRPEKPATGEYSCRHWWGGSAKLRNEHRHNTAKYNLKYERKETKQEAVIIIIIIIII